MIYDNLFTWQKKIVDKFKSRESLGLFLDMGLGKTPIALAFAEANHCNKVIVVTINSKALETVTTEGSWFYWANKSNINYTAYSKTDKSFPAKQAILVVNYESLFDRSSKQFQLKSNIVNFINTCKDENVAFIIDESHKLKNLQSLQTKSVNMIQRHLKFRANAVYTYLLTGTPFTTGYIDLYSQLKTLGYQSNKSDFVDKFCVKGNVPGLLGWQQPIIGYKNLDALYNDIHKYAITLKSEDVVNLPDKVFVNHSSNESEDFELFTTEFISGSKLNIVCKKRHLSDTFDDKKQANPFYSNIAYPSLDYLAETSGTFWLRARQLSIGFQGNASSVVWYDRRRLKQLEQLLTDFPDNYVLFYNYTPELYELFDICEKLNYNIDVYCGEIKSMTFYNKYASLTEEEKLVNTKNIILANFASGSTGMNWQAYNKCILFSLPLYKDYEQSIKRIHRLGQKQTTIYHIFYQANWLDSAMKKALENQIQYSLDMFNSDLQAKKLLL